MSRLSDQKVPRAEWTPGLFAAGGVVAITAVGFLLFGAQGAATQAGLHVDEDALDIGTVWARSDFGWTLPVENRNSRRIVVGQVEASCACTDVAPTSFALAPTARRDLTLNLDLFPPTGKVNSHESPFGISLDFRDGFGRRLAQKIVHGHVRYPLTGSSEITYFGPDELIERTPAPEKSCEFRRDFDVADVVVGEHDFPGTATLEKDGAGRTVWLFVRPAESLQAGRFEYVIPLIAILHDGTRLPNFPVRIAGWVQPEITTVPSRLNLSPAPAGETMRTTVQVQSRSGIPFRVVDAASDSDDIDIKLLDPAAPGGPLYEVSRRITASGAVNDTLRFTIERDNGNRSSITVPLRSYGLAAGELAP